MVAWLPPGRSLGLTYVKKGFYTPQVLSILSLLSIQPFDNRIIVHFLYFLAEFLVIKYVHKCILCLNLVEMSH